MGGYLSSCLFGCMTNGWVWFGWVWCMDTKMEGVVVVVMVWQTRPLSLSVSSSRHLSALLTIPYTHTHTCGTQTGHLQYQRPQHLYRRQVRSGRDFWPVPWQCASREGGDGCQARGCGVEQGRSCGDAERLQVIDERETERQRDRETEKCVCQ